MDIQIDIYFLLLGCFHCGLLTNTEMVFPLDQAENITLDIILNQLILFSLQLL